MLDAVFYFASQAAQFKNAGGVLCNSKGEDFRQRDFAARGKQIEQPISLRCTGAAHLPDPGPRGLQTLVEFGGSVGQQAQTAALGIRPNGKGAALQAEAKRVCFDR
jgi:hypothetical protein